MNRFALYPTTSYNLIRNEFSKQFPNNYAYIFHGIYKKDTDWMDFYLITLFKYSWIIHQFMNSNFTSTDLYFLHLIFCCNDPNPITISWNAVHSGFSLIVKFIFVDRKSVLSMLDHLYHNVEIQRHHFSQFVGSTIYLYLLFSWPTWNVKCNAGECRYLHSRRIRFPEITHF